MKRARKARGGIRGLWSRIRGRGRADPDEGVAQQPAAASSVEALPPSPLPTPVLAVPASVLGMSM